MASPWLVHHAAQPGAATHVLAIGVGHYPHLLGGEGPLLLEHQQLGQLSSPPVSARSVASWFVESFHSPTRPLGSVRLLTSEAAPTQFVNVKTGASHELPAATLDNVHTAFDEWVADGDLSPDNLVIFYFCGHGLANNAFTALLLEDFGADPANALDGAMDFYRNRLGMNRCKARQQLYLVDACRTSAEMTKSAGDYAGRVFIQPSAKGSVGLARPVLYATLLGQQAYGRENLPSHFAEAVVAGFRGTGGDRAQGDWRVRTSGLHTAIETHTNRKVKNGLASSQTPIADELTTFDLHHLPGPPDVPVVVSCKPAAALAAANLRCVTPQGVVQERPPTAAEWALELKVGSYDFEASFPAGPFVATARRGELVYPPELNVPIEVPV